MQQRQQGTQTIERPTEQRSGRKIVLTTFGSLGDLHPMIALGLGLKQRGHKVVIATSPHYRPNVEVEGLGFHGLRPDVSNQLRDRALYRQIMDAKTGSEFIFKNIVMPSLRDTYDDLAKAAQDADMLLTHPLALVGPLLAEKTGIRWASYALAPISMLSQHDFPVLAPQPVLSKLGRIPPFGALLKSVSHKMVLPWTAPVARLRQELGLPPGRNPIFEGQHSPLLTLAFWWEEFGRPQPDWPKSARVVGFPYYDRKEGQGMPPELEAFLQSGSPPLVFTLGSAAVMDAGDFFEVSIRGALRANRRAVLLTGPEGHNPLPNPLPKGIIAVPYAPYSELFFRACAIVHSGGVGTTAQALRAGRPQLIVPFSHDQFDNAARVARLGAGRVMPRHRYRILHVGADLMRMTNDTPYQEKAKQVAQRMEGMDGARAACDAIESVLYSPRSA